MLDNLNFSGKGKLPLVLQNETSECALACLAMIASFHGYEVTLTDLRKQFPVSLKGVSLDQLMEMATSIKLQSRPLKLELDELVELTCPCILHWDINHFVVLQKFQKGLVTIHDPANGKLHVSLAQIGERFTGIALELGPSFEFKRKSATPPIKIFELTGKIVGLKRSLVQVFLLAMALETIGIILPMCTEWITDDAIASGEHELLNLVSMGIIFLGLVQAIIGTLRSWIGIYISTSFNIQWMSNVMSHLLRLPIDFFEKRHLGDIVNRFSTVKTIERTLTTTVVDSFLDGILAIGTLMMMLIYSSQLTAIAVAVTIAYMVVRWLRLNAVKMANQGLFTKQSIEQTYFLETVRGARSIKLFNKEITRHASWLNLVVNSTNADIYLQKMNLSFSACWSLLSAIEKGAIIWMGASFVIDGKMTLGMLFAYLSYKEQFVSRAISLIDKIVDVKMLGVQTERLADIVLTAPEERAGDFRTELPEGTMLSFEQLSFRYAPGEPAILVSNTLHINPGECVAFVGPSGGGKTTTMKLLLGILKPTQGKVCLDNVALDKIGLRNYRSIVATVMQDDQVYAGSIFDNISFFDANPDKHWLEKCAVISCIHYEIMAMPMGYHTLVGDMGTVLSGGQKQRILIARALYKKPKIIFMDEATSHLDIHNEREINKMISALKITRIIIAHRPQSISVADRVLHVENGKISEARTVQTPTTAADTVLTAGASAIESDSPDQATLSH